MKSPIFLVLAFLSLLFFSCSDDLTYIGSQIQPEGDKIVYDTATVSLSTENYYPDFIYSRPDSVLLGTFKDNFYGRLYADILAQVQPPIDFSYPAGSVADSAKVILYYYTWFGDTYSPMQVNIYEMNQGNTFSYTQAYKSNINVADYCDRSVKIGSRIFTAKDAVIVRSDTTTMEFPLTNSFVQRFSPVLTKKYTDSNANEFQQFFNGLYITTDFGSASMLNIRGVVLRYYFHYTYQTKAVDGVTDSTAIVKTYVNYPSNSEVRMVNRFQLPDRESLKSNFEADDQVNYLSSPSNIYTKISLPFSTLKSKLNVGSKTLLINRANLRVDINEIDNTDYAQKTAYNLLLVKQEAYDRFFRTRELPSDTCAILASYTYETDSITNKKNYYYSFDIAGIITNELKNSPNSESLNFMLVPVTLQYNGSSSVIAVKEENLMRVVKLNSGKNKTRPMKVSLVYSGF